MTRQLKKSVKNQFSPLSQYFVLLRGPGHYPYLPVRTAASGTSK